MPLRKSHVRTAAMLAANRSNAQKGTEPSTPEGKARAALNVPKHGRRAVRLPEKLLQAGERQADQMAAAAWCVARDMVRLRTKPESPLDSEPIGARGHVQSRIRIVDHRRRIGLADSLSTSTGAVPARRGGQLKYVDNG